MLNAIKLFGRNRGRIRGYPRNLHSPNYIRARHSSWLDRIVELLDSLAISFGNFDGTRAKEKRERERERESSLLLSMILALLEVAVPI